MEKARKWQPFLIQNDSKLTPNIDMPSTSFLTYTMLTNTMYTISEV